MTNIETEGTCDVYIYELTSETTYIGEKSFDALK